MPTTPIHALPYPLPTDPADVPADMQKLALAIDPSLLPTDTVVAAATRIIRNMLVAGDAQPAWAVYGSGRQVWGAGGASATDVTLERSLAGTLRATGSNFHVGTVDNASPLLSTGAGAYMNAGGALGSIRTALGPAFNATLVGDTVAQRFSIDSNGSHTWGPGNAAFDTTLQRQSAGLLRGLSTALYLDKDIVANYGNATNQTWIDPLGRILFGGSSDVYLYRLAAGWLGLQGTGGIQVAGSIYAQVGGGAMGFVYNPNVGGNTGYAGFAVIVQGEANARWSMDGTGAMKWGPGGATAWDTNLYRAASTVLKTDQSFAAGMSVIANHSATNTQIWMHTDGSIYWGTAADTRLYRDHAQTLRVGASQLWVDLDVAARYNHVSGQTLIGIGGVGVPSSQGGVSIGQAGDCGIYREAAGQIRVNGNWNVGGALFQGSGGPGAPYSGLNINIPGIGSRWVAVAGPDTGPPGAAGGWRMLMVLN
jgi:hypothetical protein